MTKGKFFGVGFALIALGLGMLGVIYPDDFKPWGEFFIGVTSFGFAICVVTLCFWLLELILDASKKAPGVPLTPPSPAQGPKAEAKSETGHIEQKNIGAHAVGNEFHLHVAPPDTPIPTSRIPARSVMPVPSFEIQLTHANVVVESTMVRYQEPGETNGEKCLVLQVMNKAAAKGQQTRAARCVFATLEFELGSRRTTVNRACWVGEESNEISIDISEMEFVLVGLPKSEEWVTYHNSNRVNPRVREHWDSPDELAKRTIAWGRHSAYTVDIKIISNDNGPTLGQTLAHRQFMLERHEVGYRAKMLAETE